MFASLGAQRGYALFYLSEILISPHALRPLSVRDKEAGASLAKAAGEHQKIVFCYGTSENFHKGEPVGLYGIEVHITQHSQRDGSYLFLVEGVERVKVSLSRYSLFGRNDPPYKIEFNAALPKLDAVQMKELRQYAKSIENSLQSSPAMHALLPREFSDRLPQAKSSDDLLGLVLPFISLDFDKELALYQKEDSLGAARELAVYVKMREQQSFVEREVLEGVQQKVGENQRNFFLQEQLKSIKKELGGEEEEESFRQKVSALPIGEKDRQKLLKDVSRFEKTTSSSPDAGVLSSYLETVLDLPWGKTEVPQVSLRSVKNALDEHHYGLTQIKEKILDYVSLAFFSNSTGSTSTLALVGPPGTGKTSLAKSIAKGLGRDFFQIALGAVGDEAELRGHRKTYIGAMPGRIIENFRKISSQSPVILLDEIEKMGRDYKGDPQSALLEILDPEQNASFVDRYLEIPFDLSHALFIVTANTVEGISRPLLDRLELVRTHSYTTAEKVAIASRHLVPEALRRLSLSEKNACFEEAALSLLVESYTAESGVRSLKRQINTVLAKICEEHLYLYQNPATRYRRYSPYYSNVASYIKTGDSEIKPESPSPHNLTVTSLDVTRYLGPPPPLHPLGDLSPQIGAILGLAWTEIGGQVLSVEVLKMAGKGDLHLTGQLGDVMKESAGIAFSYVKAHLPEWGFDQKAVVEHDFHVHFPAGATPKDGPSAGLALSCALFSAISEKLPPAVAMTGEVTLLGKVLPIGGVREKVFAAYREGIESLILPRDNEGDMQELPPSIFNKIHFHLVESIDEAYRILGFI